MPSSACPFSHVQGKTQELSQSDGKWRSDRWGEMNKRGRSPTIYDIAKRANVSFKTVSRVINNMPSVGADLRERVEQAIKELDYRPNPAARSLAGPRAYTLVLLVESAIAGPPDDFNFYRGPFIDELEAGALRSCQAMGYRFAVKGINLAGGDYSADLDKLSDVPVDGVLLAPPACDSAKLLDELDARGIPFARIAPGVDLERGTTVSIDDYAAAVSATQYLLEAGHRHIAMIAGPKKHLAACRRVDGFLDTMAQHPGTSSPPIVYGDFLPWTAHTAAKEMLTDPNPPTAIFAANDGMAAGVLGAAIDLGLKAPDQISVIGFDDTKLAYFTWPPLTTIHQPLRDMSRAAIRYLVSVIDGSATGVERILLDHRLVERKSVSRRT